MESPELAFTIWLLACVSGPADGYPNGKVTEACSSMMPLHGHYPQLTPKHIITASETEFRPGDHIKGIVTFMLKQLWSKIDSIWTQPL